MPPGSGRVQLALLRHLGRSEAGASAAELACRVFATATPTRSQCESVRRALRTLTRQGLVAGQRAVFVPA